jgi:hypothetical protein
VLKEFLAVTDGTGFATTLTFRLTVACDRVSGLWCSLIRHSPSRTRR